MPNLNLAKYRNFNDGDVLDAEDLDVGIQQYIADEQDAIINDTVGNGVVSTSSSNAGWAVSIGSGLSVNISSGVGYISGQRFYSTGTTNLSSLTANVGGSSYLKIYAYASTSGYSTTNKAWPIAFGQTSGNIPSESILLALVQTGASSVTSVTDQRFLIESQSIMAGSVQDVTPADSARSVRQRLGMITKRIKDILGTNGWKDAVPITLIELVGKFSATTGHTHDGVDGNGPKVDASDVTFSSTSLSATNVQDALEELNNTKLSNTGGTLTGPLVLNYTPTLNSHAVNKSYVDQSLTSAPQIQSVALTANLTTSTGNEITVGQVAITTTAGSVSAVTEGIFSGYIFVGDGATRTYTIKFYRDTTVLKTITQSVSCPAGGSSRSGIIVCNIPVFYDTLVSTGSSPGPGTYTYKVTILETTTGSSLGVLATTGNLKLSATPGNFNVLEIK